MSQEEQRLRLGQQRETEQAITLDSEVLLRHMLALGASGSGKTVLSKAVVEDTLRLGIPAICIDPQGDLCSLALPGDSADTTLAQQYRDRIDAVIFTPASHTGIPLSADPLLALATNIPPQERLQAISGMAVQLVSLLGYAIDSDDGEGLIAVFDRALNLLWERNDWPDSIATFAAWFASLENDDLEILSRYLEPRRIEKATRKLARLDVGTRRHLFHDGLPLDIDTLLGRNAQIPVIPGKTRLAIIYLNTLQTQEDKIFLIAALAERLYNWMLRQPSRQPQLLFYIDEIAPFIPPIRKPASKPALSLLFKQARKYGVCCLMATQNPGDLDYKALAQFGSWALGRMTVRQDINKISPSVRALAGEQADSVLAALPAQTAGQFQLLSPDAFEQPQALQARWLYSQHTTLDEQSIKTLAAQHQWAKRYQLPTATPAINPQSTSQPQQPSPKQSEEQVAKPAPAKKSQTGKAAPESTNHLDTLATRPSMSAAEFASASGLSESRARQVLKTLVNEGEVAKFKQGRSFRYWVIKGGYRPDLGLIKDVLAFAPQVDKAQAEKLAIEEHLEGPWMGMFGFDEHLEGMELFHFMALRLMFRETVQRHFLGRLFGPSHEEHHDSLYLHPLDLRFVLFHPKRGIRLESELAHERASAVADFDDSARLVPCRPGELNFDIREWQQRCPDQQVIEHFAQRFDAVPERVEPVFIPAWRFRYIADRRGSTRVIAVDALSGQPFAW